MEKMTLGRTGLVISRSGFGALPIQRVSFEEAASLLNRALDAGINYIDTARAYSDSEAKIGAGIGNRRSEFHIATKTHAKTGEALKKDLETSLRELDEGVVEAAQSMGATPFQIITKVMIPECLPGLISSMTTALTTILGYSAMSGVIGGGGLGKIALSYGYYRYQTDIMIVCVILLVLMVQVFQTLGTAWATRSDKRLRK